MAKDKGHIYWDEAWTPITGCAGKGCKVHKPCWAEIMVRQYPHLHGYFEVPAPDGFAFGALPFNKIQFHPDRLDKPLHWKKPRTIAVCWLGDLFDDQVKPEWLDDIMAVVADKRCEQHRFLFLTKQARNMRERLAEYHIHKNTWLGISVTDQDDLDRMAPDLLQIPGNLWVSIEPMLRPVFFHEVQWKHGYMKVRGEKGILPDPKEWDDFVYWLKHDAIKWVVVGSESGPNRRPCKLSWVESVVEQCDAAQVPVWVKQLDLFKIDSTRRNAAVHYLCKDISQFPKHLQRREKPQGFGV